MANVFDHADRASSALIACWSVAFFAVLAGDCFVSGVCVVIGVASTAGFGFFTAKKSRMDFSGAALRFAGALTDDADVLARNGTAK